MSARKDWNRLSHEDKIKVLSNSNNDEIIKQYTRPDAFDDNEFRILIEKDRRFWQPDNVDSIEYPGEAPTKESTIGAWRDLNRAEALLELIDNSIDAWIRRKARYPKETAKKLLIYIDVKNGILTYEDNAGGVEKDKLINLIVPGFSDTIETEHTIGSYRTGGKKAIFKLASEVSIRTRYWSPVGTSSDDAFEIHLDKDWLGDSKKYPFPCIRLKDKTVLEKGQTIYFFRLPKDLADWEQDTDAILLVTSEIRKNYTLLMLRHPEIEIHFMDRSKPLTPIQNMYKFTGIKESPKGIDLRPQKMTFNCKIEREGETHDVAIEIVLGCRTTTAEKKGDDVWGIDLYGNDRLFVYQEYELFLDWFRFKLPKGAARRFVRGYINIIGPNFLVPWDTHKRHLNSEREVVDVLKKDRLIKEFFERWGKAYQALSASESIKKIISKPIDPWKDKTDNDLNVPIQGTVSIQKRKRGNANVELPISSPIVPASKSVSKPMELRLRFSRKEIKLLLEEYEIGDDVGDKKALKQLETAIRDHILNS